MFNIDINKSYKVLRFHNPEEENGFLSNWYESEFIVDDVQYSSMEQYMMHQKAVLFNDNKIAALILKTNDVREIKRLGREVTGYNDTVWNGFRQLIVCKGLLCKFSLNKLHKEELIKTGDDILAECAVKDQIWGIGLSMSDARADDINTWRGQNLLGFALMKVRDIIMQSEPCGSD